MIAAIFGDETMFDKLFSRHMKIERMLLVCGLLICVLMCVLTYDGVILYKRSQVKLSDAPILTGSSVTSLTGQSFTIDGVYRSEDNTQAMVVISGDLSSVSYIADAYQIYMLGPSAAEFSGGLYVFGDLDKICVYVTKTDGFKLEQTQILLKSTASTMATSKETTDDMSFWVNLGASGAETAPFMTSAGLNIEQMTKSVFGQNDDSSIKDELVLLQDTMVDARVSLANIRENLSKSGVQLPVLPEWMNFVDENGDTISDPVGQRANTGREYIMTSYVFAGAADFDWENASRLDNYAEISGISPESIDSEAERPQVEDYLPVDWYRNDNSLIDVPTKSEHALMTQYSNVLKQYYDAKIQYQDKVAELIVTQDNYLKSMRNYTSNIGGDAIVGVTQK